MSYSLRSEKSNFLIFILTELSGKTVVYKVFTRSDNSLLGTIKWYSSWRQYCFFPLKHYVWNSVCLFDLYKFLCELKESRKRKLI